MKSLKKIIVFFAFLGSVSGAFAQLAVMEANSTIHLLTAIDTFYQTYDEINSMIESVQQGYERIQQAYDMVASIDWDKLDDEGIWSDEGGLQGAWENIGNARKNFKDKASYISANVARVQAARNKLNNTAISYGGQNFTLKELCGGGKTEKNIFGLTKSIAEAHIERLKQNKEVANMSSNERTKLWAKYGVSPELKNAIDSTTSVTTLAVEKLIGGVSSDLEKVNAEIDGAEIVTDMQRIDMAADGTDSLKEGARLTNEMLVGVKSKLNNLNNGLKELGALFASQEVQRQIEKEAAADERYYQYLQKKIDDSRNSHLSDGDDF